MPPVKRALKLDVLLQENYKPRVRDPCLWKEAPRMSGPVHTWLWELWPPKSRRTSGHLIASYSPTTGTRQISPYSSPKSHNGQEFGNGPSDEQMDLDQTHEFPRRGQPRAEDKNNIMMLLYKIDSSLEKFTETWKSLKHLQALLGRPELENLLGVSSVSLDLRGQVKRIRELMMKVRKQEQLKKKTLKHFPRGIRKKCIQ
ncbi:centromere protein R-like isoform X2 [Petaurus breviceps papuanus]|uniref:centromere protein R-like isoform X2 n=1 Tax=Petaurus breviceps papuanus TaxID=3040969 RepID=UPI0036DB29A1